MYNYKIKVWLPSKINEIFFQLNLFTKSYVACAKCVYSADISTVFSQWSKGMLFPWRRTRGMPVMVESAHAVVVDWLPPISTVIFCWRNAVVAGKIIIYEKLKLTLFSTS